LHHFYHLLLEEQLFGLDQGDSPIGANLEG